MAEEKLEGLLDIEQISAALSQCTGLRSTRIDRARNLLEMERKVAGEVDHDSLLAAVEECNKAGLTGSRRLTAANERLAAAAELALLLQPRQTSRPTSPSHRPASPTLTRGENGLVRDTLEIRRLLSACAPMTVILSIANQHALHSELHSALWADLAFDSFTGARRGE